MADEKADVEKIKDGKVLSERSCTDCLLIIVAFVFVIGWIVIISVAASSGKPTRLVMPENFRGQLCGDDGPLATYPHVFFPRPSRTSYGICVQKCPGVGDYICNADEEPLLADATGRLVPNFYYNHNLTEATDAAALYARCLFTTCSAAERSVLDRFVGLNLKVQQYKCFLTFYKTASTIYRCLPSSNGNDNATLAESAGESLQTISSLSEYTGAAAFFTRGFGEMEQCWPVILICSFTAMVFSLLWLFLLRWILKPLVYLCILLILVLLIVVGYLAMLIADDLENVKLPGDTATDNQLKLWRALQYAAWILAAMYIVVMMWMIKRIKIAIIIMKQASRAFLATPSMIIVPPIVFVFVLGWIAFFIVTAVYIQTVGQLKDGQFREAAVGTFGVQAVNTTEYFANRTSTSAADFAASQNISSNSSNKTLNSSQWTQSEQVKAMHAYNFFGFLWATSFCIMFGYFCMAMSVVAYYFSATQEEVQFAESSEADVREKGRTRGTPTFVILRSLFIALRYHLGTILFGSLLIAIVQFIRALMVYLEEQFLHEWKEMATVKCLIYCIDCCLACIERCIKIISKNAFIITCIKNTNFCSSAGRAMGILVNNAARVSILAMLATVACFVLKVFIVGCNMIVAWGLTRVPSLTKNRKVESGLFPLMGILIISFIIATLFINVYECCVDTIMMSFLIDEEDLGGAFMDKELAELLGLFKDAEDARMNYEKQLKNATAKKKVAGTEATEPPAQ